MNGDEGGKEEGRDPEEGSPNLLLILFVITIGRARGAELRSYCRRGAGFQQS